MMSGLSRTAGAGLIAILVLPVGPVTAQDPAPAGGPDQGQTRAEGVAARSSEPERVVKSDEEWRRLLTYEQYMVTRHKATEPAFTGRYAHGHFNGMFACICCDARLFDSRHKFDSGTGWPSFWRAASDRVIETEWDYSEPEARVEVMCRRCGAHLGHVFQDGPAPTGLRFCINSAALRLVKDPVRATSVSRSAQAAPSKRATSRARTTRSKSKRQYQDSAPNVEVTHETTSPHSGS